MTLKGAKPPVWRRILVPAEIRLSRLHDVLQAAMGWTNSHLHEFRVGRDVRIGTADPQWDAPGEVMDEHKVALSSLAPEPKDKLTYVYDFGDDWEHTVAVAKILEPSPGAIVPSCLSGKGACPPEDCGGVWGYGELLDVLADPDHPEREERLEWLGEDWDPLAFDLEAVNRRLAPFRKE
ncbi:MAG: plasmid pRiA4b ORF-3 family protein [Thermodesulfobacteriota bacterium]